MRELGNIVERLVILHPGAELTSAHVRAVLPGVSPGVSPAGTVTAEGAEVPLALADGAFPPPTLDAPLTDTLDEYERMLIARALSAAGGNVTEAARRLQTDRPNLYRRMRRLGIALGGVILTLLAALAMLSALPRPVDAQEEGGGEGTDTIPPAAAAGRGDSVPPDTARARADSARADSIARDSSGVVAEGERWWRRWLVPHRSGDWFGFAVTSAHTYNRLEGLPVYLGPGVRKELPWGSVHADAYGILRTAELPQWEERDIGYTATTELRVGHARAVAVGARLYDEIDPVEDWQLSDGEVGLASFFFHKDYRDYFDRHGATGYVTIAATGDASLDFTYGDERWSSRTALNPLTIVDNGTGWRANPELDDGVFHVAGAHLAIDSRNDEANPWAGWFLKADVERGTGHVTHFGPRSDTPANADSGGGSDTYWRGFFDLRRYNRINPLMSLNVRAVFGGWLGGDQLPLETRLSVGGAGTLPGFGFRSPGLGAGTDVAACGDNGGPTPVAVAGKPAQCDRVALLQTEFRHDLHIGLGRWARNAQLDGAWIFFADAGRGWLVGPRAGALQFPAAELPPLDSFMSDAGVGISIAPVGLYVAEPLSRGNGVPRVVIRVVQRF